MKERRRKEERQTVIYLYPESRTHETVWTVAVEARGLHEHPDGEPWGSGGWEKRTGKTKNEKQTENKKKKEQTKQASSNAGRTGIANSIAR